MDESMLDKSELTTDQLITLYLNMTQGIRNRDNFFIPLSFAVIPIVFSSWEKMNVLNLVIFAISSIFLYVINLLFIFRLTAYQDEVIRILNRSTNFYEIVRVKKTHYSGKRLFEKKLLIRVRTLRIVTLFGLTVIWAAIILSKFYHL